MSEGARIDKWLWAARFFKTRGLAGEKCGEDRVLRVGKVLKAGSTPHVGDVLEFPFPEGPGVRTVEVREVIQKRVAAPIARVCYEETTAAEVFEVQKEWHRARMEAPKGRPTKRNRREIDRIHGFWD